MAFKLVRKTIFEQIYNFCVIMFLFFLDIIKVYNEKVISFCFVFLIMLHIYTFTPSILLSVNFGLPGENLVTSAIESAIKVQKMEDACKVGHKNCKIIFGVEEVQKSSYVKSKSKTR